VILTITLSYAHPFGNPRKADASPSQLLGGAQIPEPLRQLVERKCGNCHSETVAWPFYARVAPVSWLVERDVVQARAHMNLSRWGAYSSEEKMDLLSRIAANAHSGEMPPARYTAIHRDSKLLSAEQDALYDWAKAERRRLRIESRQPRVDNDQQSRTD
jgi:cytochrome c